MNRPLDTFIMTNRSVLAAIGHRWDIEVDPRGKASKDSAWNLTRMVGGVTKPTHYLNHLGADEAAANALRLIGSDKRSNAPEPLLSESWQDLIKAAVVDQLFVRRNSTGHVVMSIVRPLRVIATCSRGKEPWQLTVDDILLGFQVAQQIQPSGKLADVVAGLVKILFDQNHLSDAGPLYPALASVRLNPRVSRRAKFLRSKDAIRNNLEDRKRAEKLPSNRAFWELVRIVMTEQPQTFLDELRFAGLRLMLVTGFRIGEVATLPFDWRRERTYHTASGSKPSALGGIDRSLMIRHFAEKQNTEGGSSLNLREAIQHVPRMFEELVQETLDRVTELTAPLRLTLRLQTQTGRILPQFRPDQFVPLLHLYPYLSGNPFWMSFDDAERREWINRCRLDLSGASFDELFRAQVSDLASGSRAVSPTAYVFFNRMKRHGSSSRTLYMRNANGAALGVHERMRWGETYLNISELESYLLQSTKTKISDTEPLRVDGEPLDADELLFIHPKRSIAEERNEGICDVTRYSAIRRPDSGFLEVALGDFDANETIFARYGRTDDDRALSLRSHSLRHLQNNELFRLGVADSIITKRFDRTSVRQSHEYDHRSLAEELASLELPPEVEFALGEKTATVLKMIQTGKASGPIVDDFKRIQLEEGDEAAFEFLRAEADGFHATPYGTCVSSFTVSPCPKHLQCFDGCRHLTSSERPEVKKNLIALEIKLLAAVEDGAARCTKTIGAANQVRHAQSMLAGVRKLLTAQPGEQVFPNGRDLSRPSAGEVE